MTKAYEHIKEYRKRIRQKILKCFDNQCGICKYDKCTAALEFHHIDPSLKEFSIKSNDVNNYERLVEELKKCVCICSNCHKEVHYNKLQLPENIIKFNEDIAKCELKSYKKEFNKCPICGNLKLVQRKCCSVKCYSVFSLKIDWSKYDLYDLVCIKRKNLKEIAKIIGTTDNNVRKRLKKLRLPVTLKERKEFIPSGCISKVEC